MEDREIVELYWARDERAIGESREKYGPLLASFARRFVGEEDAEECVSDAYLRAWNAIPPERPENLRAYLAKILRNLCLDRLRRDRAHKRDSRILEVTDELQAVAPDSALEKVTAQELSDYVNRFLRTLSRRDGDILIRRCFWAESVGEIARRYSMRPNAVSVSLTRSRRKLAEYLRKEGLIP